MKKFLTAALAGMTLAAGIGAAEVAQAQPGYYYRDGYGGRAWNGGRWDNGRYHNRYYGRRNNDGALAALAAGALIGSAVAQGNRGYYGGGYGYDGGYGYYDGGGYYDRPYRVRCFNQRIWDPYWGRTVVRRVCR
ncbi:hypothetical protein [Phenylobacterium immobile]|uniref:hypothetical protein n=1 Tax=Phenylobacterium immobile TaxID=21 RepID=UPI000AC48EC7|nr:hypothetical protein [Phenylobacterium immobile]